jgi:hypothetical protein
MVADALQHRFLVREFEILRPKAVILLGERSHTAFYTHLLTATVGKTSRGFELLSPSSELAEYNGATVVPFLHPSPRSGIFARWFKNSRSTLCEQPHIQAIAASLALNVSVSASANAWPKLLAVVLVSPLRE